MTTMHIATGTGLDPATGMVSINGHPVFQAWNPGRRACSTAICGNQATGKTELARWLAREHTRSRVAVTWAADPHGISPVIFDGHAAAASGVDATMLMLWDAYAVMTARLQVMAPGFTPTTELPLLRVIIDNAIALFRDRRRGREARDLHEDLVRRGGPFGIAVDITTADWPLMYSMGCRDFLTVVETATIDGEPGFIASPGPGGLRVPYVGALPVTEAAADLDSTSAQAVMWTFRQIAGQ